MANEKWQEKEVRTKNLMPNLNTGAKCKAITELLPL
jgi:hypothetical protein